MNLILTKTWKPIIKFFTFYAKDRFPDLRAIHSLRNANYTVFETPSPCPDAPYYSSPYKLTNSVTNQDTPFPAEALRNR